MQPPIIDRTTLLALAVIVLVGGAVILTALRQAYGWNVRLPRWTGGAVAVAVLVGLSLWHDRATTIQIEACGTAFDSYMGRDDYPGWSASCSEVMLSAAVKDKSRLARLCVDNANALLGGGSVFESRFVFQENYCRKALGQDDQAMVASALAARCTETQARLASGSRDSLAAFGRLCPDDRVMTKAALPQ